MHLSFTKDLDILGASLSFFSTIFYIAANRLAWPISLLAIGINLVLYYKTGLFADTLKESVYAISCLLGWYWWLHGGKKKKALNIRRINRQHAFVLLLLSVLSSAILSWLLIHAMHSSVPYWDAITTILSLTAQWLICRKIIECWILWFIVDVLYAGLYFYKGLPVHGGLMALYTMMAVVGYMTWYRKIKTE